jgi:hypothetical protein
VGSGEVNGKHVHRWCINTQESQQEGEGRESERRGNSDYRLYTSETHIEVAVPAAKLAKTFLNTEGRSTLTVLLKQALGRQNDIIAAS